MTNPTKGRILVVDDDPVFREMLQCMLSDDGFEVETAINGLEALSMYRENPADLVIADIIMPEKEGIETIIELKRDYPGVKIIAISGGGSHGPKAYLDTARLLGVKHTFFKPFEVAELIATAKELVGS